MGYKVLHSGVEWYPQGLDILLMSESLDLAGEWSWLNLAPSRLPRSILPFFHSIDILQQEPNSLVGARQAIVEVFHWEIVD